MAVNIEDNIKRIQLKIEHERSKSPDGRVSQTALKLQKLALAAIMGGTPSWQEYMEVFAQDENGVLDPAALARLQPETDASASFSRNLARAYLIGNGTCGIATPDGQPLIFGVTGTLDFDDSTEGDSEDSDWGEMGEATEDLWNTAAADSSKSAA